MSANAPRAAAPSAPSASTESVTDLRVGSIGLGNVDGKLAGSLVRNGVTTQVLDLDPAAMRRTARCPAVVTGPPPATSRSSSRRRTS